MVFIFSINKEELEHSQVKDKTSESDEWYERIVELDE